MFIDWTTTRIFVKPGSTDMRKQINGLAAMVQGEMGADPFSGSLYLFSGKTRKLLKVLYWDRNGFCMWQKKLERDHFPWPDNEESAREITVEQLRMVFNGIDFWHAHQRLSYSTVL
jgi:transposase